MLDPDRTDAVNRLLGRAQFLVSALVEIIDANVLQEIAGKDFTLNQLQLLRLISVKSDHSIGSLASHLGVSSPAVSKTIDRMVQRMFLRRVERESDRRAVQLSLTELGRRILTRFDDARNARVEQICPDLPVTELNRASELLQQLASRIVELDSTPAE